MELAKLCMDCDLPRLRNAIADIEKDHLAGRIPDLSPWAPDLSELADRLNALARIAQKEPANV